MHLLLRVGRGHCDLGHGLRLSPGTRRGTPGQPADGLPDRRHLGARGLDVQRHKPKVVRALHEAQERFREVEAVDAAVPDGAAASFQGYAAAAWNQSPLPDTSVGPSFREWKRAVSRFRS